MPKLKDPEIQSKITSRVVYAIEQLIDMGVIRNQKEFAKKSGYKEANLSKVMNGERQAPLMLIHFLAFGFSISPQWMILGTGKMYIKN